MKTHIKTINSISAKINTCKSCELYKERTNTVPGYGSNSAEILFIGEAPGKNEDLQGRPFIGAAGKLLDQLLQSINLNRKDIFITNIVKCRPPKNRDPKENEIKACSKYLKQQVKILQPKLICLLGRHATNRFIPNVKISEVHGKAMKYKGINNGEQIYLPLYHPAYALYNGSFRTILEKDIKQIPKIIKNINNKTI